MAQKLITADIRKKAPKLRSTSELKSSEVKVIAKFFGGAACTWYMTEYDPDVNLAFGFVTLGDHEMAELGYFSITELSEIRFRPFGSVVERDMYFGKHTLEEVINSVREGKPL
jgi:hypothetical protein